MQAMKRLPVRRIPSAAAGHTKLQFNGRSLHIWLPDTESARSFRHSGLIYGDVATPSSHVEDEQQAITTNQLPAAAKATEPTEKLRELMAKDKLLAEKVERIQKEFEIYEYFSSYVPTKFEDKNWLYLLRTNTIIDRVRYYWFMGLVEGRQEQDSVRTKENHSMKVEQFDDGQKIYDAGGMVYRPGFYRHLHNPMTNMKSLIPYGLWNSVEMSMTEQRPKLLFDCQFLHDCAPQFYGRTTQGGAHAYWVNYERRDPLPNAFVNVNKEDPFTQNFITKYVFPLNTSGFHRDYKIFPQLHPNNPYHDPNEKDPTKQVIYISKFAKEQLDGPLIHKAYVIPLAFDKFRETIGAARRGNYRTMYLPIRKYIKWRSGAIKIPFVGLVNIFNEVANNGGDWAYALEKFIPRLNKMSLDERKQQLGKGRHQKIMDEREERQRISTTIFESLGQQPVIFAPEQDTKTRATILEYARSLEKF